MTDSKRRRWTDEETTTLMVLVNKHQIQDRISWDLVYRDFNINKPITEQRQKQHLTQKFYQMMKKRKHPDIPDSKPPPKKIKKESPSTPSSAQFSSTPSTPITNGTTSTVLFKIPNCNSIENSNSAIDGFEELLIISLKHEGEFFFFLYQFFGELENSLKEKKLDFLSFKIDYDVIAKQWNDLRPVYETPQFQEIHYASPFIENEKVVSIIIITFGRLEFVNQKVLQQVYVNILHNAVQNLWKSLKIWILNLKCISMRWSFKFQTQCQKSFKNH